VKVIETFFALPVADMARATAFYQRAFGATVSFSTPVWSSLHVAGVRVGLYPDAAARSVGLHFLVEDLAATRAAIESAGGRMGATVEPAPGVSLTMASDSEGNTLTLRQA
jgi:predicted enzyme related to lactoylglutathione lyase